MPRKPQPLLQRTLGLEQGWSRVRQRLAWRNRVVLCRLAAKSALVCPQVAVAGVCGRLRLFGGEPAVRVGDHQPHACEARAAQRVDELLPEPFAELLPEPFALAVADVADLDLPVAACGDAGGDHGGHLRVLLNESAIPLTEDHTDGPPKMGPHGYCKTPPPGGHCRARCSRASTGSRAWRSLTSTNPSTRRRWRSDSILVAACNHRVMIDFASWRRFDEIVHLPRPDGAARSRSCDRTSPTQDP